MDYNKEMEKIKNMKKEMAAIQKRIEKAMENTDSIELEKCYAEKKENMDRFYKK